MKSFATVALVLLAAVSAASAAPQSSHIRVRVHSSSHQKLYITPMGEQCAYNASIDPSMYPCRGGGVCVRKNETYGVCELPGQASESGSDDSDGSGSVELQGSDESDDVDGEEDEEEYEDEDEDDSVDSTSE